MNPDTPSFKTIQRRERAMATVAALTASAGINAAVVFCFDSTSPALWLVPTPAVLERLAHCETRHTRAQQDDCKQQVAAQRPSQKAQAVQVAGR